MATYDIRKLSALLIFLDVIAVYVNGASGRSYAVV